MRRLEENSAQRSHVFHAHVSQNLAAALVLNTAKEQTSQDVENKINIFGKSRNCDCVAFMAFLLSSFV